MSRLLLTSADQDASDSLIGGLAGTGFDVIRAGDGQETKARQRDHQPEIILIDTPLPDVDGLELTRELRAATTVPIVLLATDVYEPHVVRALELGADEFLLKPIRMRELAARLRALLRRTNGFHPSAIDGRLSIGDLDVRLDERRVYKRGRLVHVSPIEFRLLVCLMREPGKVLSHRRLMAEVWGGEYVDCPHYLRLYIRYLRSKLEDDPRRPKMILNAWGLGYRFEAPES